MKTHHVTQGSPDWLALRASHFTASEAAAMMNCSPYETRAALLRRKATGLSEDVDSVKQRIFDAGHAAEAAFLPHAEEIVGDELYPATGSAEIDGLPLLASFDGITADGKTLFEHKAWSSKIAAELREFGEPPEHYIWQLEHQLLVSGARRVLFVTSNGGPGEQCAWSWCVSHPGRRAQLIAGWQQFAADLAKWEPQAAPAQKPTGKAPDTLPALRIELSGQVTASNLAEFREVALSAIRSVNRELVTDADFADAEKAVKWCADVETRIKAAKEHALSQTASIDALFRTLEDITAEARTVRLDLEKLVKAEKEARKAQIVKAAQDKTRAYLAALNGELGRYEIGLPMDAINDLALAVKGKRDLASMEDACAAVVSRRCAEFEELARRIRANRALIEAAEGQHPGIAPDARTLAHTKAPEDLSAILAQRVAERKAAIERELEIAKRQLVAQEAANALRLAAEAAAAVVAKQAADHVPDTGKMVEAPQPAPAVIEAAPPATFKLSDINRHIAPLMIDSAGLRTIGFEPHAKDRAALLYRASDLPAMVKAMQRLLNAVLLVEEV